jgi:hypothetical protein
MQNAVKAPSPHSASGCAYAVFFGQHSLQTICTYGKHQKKLRGHSASGCAYVVFFGQHSLQTIRTFSKY